MMKKISFKLVQDEDGYPPAAVESVWATQETNNYYRLENTPFFTTEATLGDMVEARSLDGLLVFEKVVRESNNSLVRIVYYDETNPNDVIKVFEKLGCTTELMSQFSLIALSIPLAVSLGRVQEALVFGAENEEWDYEEPILRHV